MLPRTRRIAVASLVAVALMLPVEMVLLKTLSASDEKTAAQSWVESLDGEELQAAALAIQDYPVVYRREIMRALSPAWRSMTWRAHLQTYLDDHPGLGPDAVTAIEDTIAILSPANMGNPNSTLAAQVAALGDELEAQLGREDAVNLLNRLGPPDEAVASRLPLTDRLANALRGLVVAMARHDDCACSTDFGCDGFFTHCSDEVSCVPDTEWPACGWGWYQDCDGMCMPGIAS